MKRYIINEITPLENSMKVFKLVPEDGENIEFKPGSFVKIWDVEERINRPYSIASSPNPDYLEFCIKIVGQFTEYLDTLEKGDELLVEGPFGHFTYEEQENCVFLAGGAGIAPIMSIVRYIENNDIKGNFVLIFSCKHEKNIYYYEELKKLKNVKVIFTLTREEWKGEKGRIDKKMIEKYVSDIEKQHWYICGPLTMCLNLRKLIGGIGGKDENVKIEGWG